MVEQIERVKTYIQGFDEAMQGGIPKGHVVLVSGTAGSMKSSICFNIAYNEALAGKNSLYISLEQSTDSLYQHLENMNIDLEKIHLVSLKDLAKIDEVVRSVKNSTKGSIIVVDIGCIRKEIKDVKVGDNKSWMNVIKNIVKKIKMETPCSLFVLDSLSALYTLSSFENPRVELFYIFEFLRDTGLTTYLISEMPLDGSKYSEYEIEDFLADGIILLKLTPFRRNIIREISIVKMRATKCNNDVFSLEFKNGKFNALYGGQNPLL
ncbi:MAG: ATPase domain-containing protein [archaeon]